MKLTLKLFTISCMIFALIKMCEAERNIDKSIEEINKIDTIMEDTPSTISVDTSILCTRTYRHFYLSKNIVCDSAGQWRKVSCDTIHDTVYMLQSPPIPNPYPQYPRMFDFDTVWNHQNYINLNVYTDSIK